MVRSPGPARARFTDATPVPAYDLIVAGSGAAGLTAAAVAAAEGARVLLLERGPLLGGTTAISGGMVWIPANHKMAQAGLADSADQAHDYLAHTLAAVSYTHLTLPTSDLV